MNNLLPSDTIIILYKIDKVYIVTVSVNNKYICLVGTCKKKY